MANKAGKGSTFEREICKALSLWYTKGASDCVYWRTSNSGGRATTRGKSGSKTTNQYGDICATDSIGQGLLNLFCIECKKGYSHSSLADLLDKPKGAAIQTWEGWIKKAIACHKAAGSKSWMIIAKRDRREAIILAPYHKWSELSDVVSPCFGVNVKIDGEWLWLIAIPFSFLLQQDPKEFGAGKNE